MFAKQRSASTKQKAESEFKVQSKFNKIYYINSTEGYRQAQQIYHIPSPAPVHLVKMRA